MTNEQQHTTPPERRPSQAPEQRPAHDGGLEKRGVLADVVQGLATGVGSGFGTYVGAKVAGVGKAPPPPPPPADSGPRVILPPGADHE